MLLLAVLLSASPVGETALVRTTPLGALAACKAKTLDQAADCLRNNLSENDRIALVAAPNGSSIRGQIDRFVQFEFRLYEPDSEVGQWLRKRGIESRMVQSSVIIDEYLAEQRGANLDLNAVAKASRGVPDGTPPTAAELSNEAADTATRTKLSREECAKITKLPLDELGECFKQGDRILVSRMEKAGSN